MPPKKGKKGKRSPKFLLPIMLLPCIDCELSRQGHPDDILPLVLTSVTQDLFGCVADENVTGESPYKLLKKDDIIQDIKTRAAVSDFSPMKQTVLDYPEDEMLLVFDSDFTYGQCFYMVLTPEAKDRILNPPQPETQETSDDEIIKTPEPKEWVSLGSEREVDEESVKESKKVQRHTLYMFSRVRRKFGEPVCFSDRNAADVRDGLVECVSYQDSRFNIRLMQRDCGMQAIPKVDSSSSQTQRKTMRNTFTQYMPKELSDEEKDNSNVDFPAAMFIHFMMMCVLYMVGMVAVALRDKKENNLNDSGTLAHRPSLILFYSFSDPCEPQLLLECPDDILAFEFCPCDPNIIVGGCINGQVVLWDISAQATHLQESDKKVSADTEKFDLDDNEENKTPVVRFCAVSALESRHKAPITDVHWLPPTFEVHRAEGHRGKMFLIFMFIFRVDQKTQVIPHSVSNVFKYLDQTWNPFFTVMPGLKMLYKAISCQNLIDKKILMASSSCSSLPGSKPLHCFNVHHWLVNTVQRSPFLKDIILTAGDSNFAIWKDDVMVTTPDASNILATVKIYQTKFSCWSLSRPAVFFIGKENGSIDVWNLLEKTSEPTHVQEHITNGRITYVKSWMLSCEFLASYNDHVHHTLELLTFCFLCVQSLSVKKYFELEEDRLKNLLMKEEMWEKEKKEAEQSKKMTTTAVSCF
uniref:Uncharacterized protein n=1 Tax=Mola mola TaxID=94237 RepID=A0A3Q4AE57_MOLML